MATVVSSVAIGDELTSMTCRWATGGLSCSMNLEERTMREEEFLLEEIKGNQSTVVVCSNPARFK